MADTFDAPQSRNEAILQNMLGANNTLPAPQSRIEELLQEILENGGGGGGASNFVVTLSCYKPFGGDWSITCDKTNAEIKSALANKAVVVASVVGNPVAPGARGTFPKCTCASYLDADTLVSFDGVTTGNNKQYFVRFYQTSEDNWTFSATAYPFPQMVEITYDDLVDLRDNGKLVAGMQYRITDYETIINGSYNLSALGAEGYIHYARSTEEGWFDIIVTADDESHLNENARAARSDGADYAPDAKPEAWELKYTIDNDPTKYAWANSTHGKGVIYYMRDEHNNSAGYDFKSIQFLRYALKLADATADYTPSDTGLVYDASTQPNRYGSPYRIFTALQNYMTSGTYVNPFPMNYKGQTAYNYDFAVGYNILGTIQFPEADDTYLSTFNADWYYTFDYYKDGEHYDISSVGFEGIDTGCRENYIAPDVDALATTLDSSTKVRGLGANCWENNYVENSETHSGFVTECHISHGSPFNTFGGRCTENKFGQACYDNIFGSQCIFNTFGNSCRSNTFGDSCYSNTFGDSCNSNTFGNNCYSNTFGDSCDSNTFGNDCDSNTFGDYCNSNTFGDSCDSNTFGNNCYSNTFGNDCDSNTFGNDCDSNTFGNYCDSNTFGNNCYSNTFGNYCDSNTLEGADDNLGLSGARYINVIALCSGVDVGATLVQDSNPYELISYDHSSGHATLIKKTGYNTETAVSTTDGGATWA